MPYGSVTLIPGVNVERTPTLNEAGYSASQLIRFKDKLAQKYGGFARFYPFAIKATPRDLHAWADLNGITHLAVGAASTTGVSSLSVITNNVISDITPQIFTSNFTANFSTIGGQTIVTIDDPNVTNPTTFDSVFFDTEVAVGGLVLSGLYPIKSITGVSSYTINAATAAVTTVNNAGAVPLFTTSATSATVKVTLATSGLSVGESISFSIPTTGSGVTISGTYPVTGVIDANDFDITVSQQAATSGSFSMNGGLVQLLYYINLGPTQPGQGYGLGAYGAGAYGFGTGSSGVQTGSPIMATDWTSDNWGEVLLACPSGGGIYAYNPLGGFTNAGLVATAPPFNGGVFVSVAQQILVAWGSTVTEAIGVQQDPLLVQWSNVGDYTAWTPGAASQAGNFRIPLGSKIRGGLATPFQNFIWTDLDLWAMNYQGPPFPFSFNKVGAGCGLIGSHAAQQLLGQVFWMGPADFYSYSASGVNVIPCPVWDAVFQNLNYAYAGNIRAMPNSPFGEVGWEFPSLASMNGENDTYVKFSLIEPGMPWDIGPVGSMPRSAWIDQNIIGMPMSASPTGLIYQQETGNDADGVAMVASLQTGFFYIGDGENYSVVDQIIPDMKFGFYGQNQTATLSFTFFVSNYPGDTPTTYGPYIFTAGTEFIPVRFRGRLVSFLIQSADLGSFWRLGKIFYRWAPSGRR